MGCIHFLHFLVVCTLLVLTVIRFEAEGRTEPQFVGGEEEKAMMLRGHIGSRPPRCERRCNTCGHCEAIQVPTNPQFSRDEKGRNSSPIVSNSKAYYVRGDDAYSNYKPMSWKCKCGNFIFNP